MRNLQKQIAEGSALLEQHQRYDLTSAELVNLFDQIGIKDTEASKSYYLFSRAFALGIAAGYRIAKTETKKN